MAGASHDTAKAYRAQGLITKRSLCVWGNADGAATLATGSAAPLLGVSAEIDCADQIICDVFREGLVDVIYGGVVNRGDPLTANATGQAVTANPAAGVNAYIVGFAEVAGVAGDVGFVFISPGRIQG